MCGGVMHGRRPSHPYDVGMEHVGIYPTRGVTAGEHGGVGHVTWTNSQV